MGKDFQQKKCENLSKLDKKRETLILLTTKALYFMDKTGSTPSVKRLITVGDVLGQMLEESLEYIT